MSNIRVKFVGKVIGEKIKISLKEEIDGKFYDIQKAFFSNKNGVEQEELLVSEGDIEIGPESIDYYPIYIRVYLVKSDSSVKKKAKYRNYYLKVSRRNNEPHIDVFKKFRTNSGRVKQNTWDKSIWIQDKNYQDNPIAELIYFYLIESPSVEGKASSNQFTDLHALWGIHCFDRTADSLRGRLMRHKVEGILDNLGGVAKSEKDMLGRLKQFGLFEIDSLKNLDIKSRVVMVDSKSNQYLSLFSHIRNSLAHGSFRFCNREDAIYFVFQDSYRKHVTARGIIEIEILKKWKDIILDKV